MTHRTGYISQASRFIIYTQHKQGSHARMYKQSNETQSYTYTGKQTQEKALQPNISKDSQALMQFYLADGATTFIQK